MYQDTIMSSSYITFEYIRTPQLGRPELIFSPLTQNIGQMLRRHFHSSQFIVVSLKDGMFNNANVLFKTKFVDGVSTVTRCVCVCVCVSITHYMASRCMLVYVHVVVFRCACVYLKEV